MDPKTKIKVFIVTGFLGAGKTTLVKRILKATPDLSKTIVLVNEFGKVGVDGSLIKQTAAADIVELSSGCICCSLKTDMIQALRMLQYEYKPERILIEATGVADPVSIMEVLQERLLASDFVIEKIITVLDADFWETREDFGTVFFNQMSHANLILLNKVDLLSPKTVPLFLEEIKTVAPKAATIPTLHCHIDPDLFWAEPTHRSGNHAAQNLFHYYDPGKDSSVFKSGKSPDNDKKATFQTFSYETHLPLDKLRFNAFLEAAPLHLFRIKGPVKFKGQTRMLNFVGGRAEWENWPDAEATNLAFIGWAIDKKEVLETVKNCHVL